MINFTCSDRSFSLRVSKKGIPKFQFPSSPKDQSTLSPRQTGNEGAVAGKSNPNHGVKTRSSPAAECHRAAIRYNLRALTATSSFERTVISTVETLSSAGSPLFLPSPLIPLYRVVARGKGQQFSSAGRHLALSSILAIRRGNGFTSTFTWSPHLFPSRRLLSLPHRVDEKTACYSS